LRRGDVPTVARYLEALRTDVPALVDSETAVDLAVQSELPEPDAELVRRLLRSPPAGSPPDSNGSSE
jgi:hypothetical protein